jgi:RimJ/RimL family protein N-acetyltransferase
LLRSVEASLMQKRILRTLVHPLVHREVYECLTLHWHGASELRPATGAASGAQVREVERAELARWSGDPALGISAKFLRTIDERNDHCFAAFVGDTVASYVFFAPTSPTAIDRHLRFQFPDGWLYVYKALTVPAWRGKRLLPHLLLEAMRHLNRPDFVTLVVSENHGSRRAFERSGFRVRERFPVWRILSRPLRASISGHSSFGIDARGSPLAAQV